MNSQNSQTIAGVIGRITAFDRKCNQAEYTDTGEAWDLLHSIKADLRSILPKKPKSGTTSND